MIKNISNSSRLDPVILLINITCCLYYYVERSWNRSQVRHCHQESEFFQNTCFSRENQYPLAARRGVTGPISSKTDVRIKRCTKCSLVRDSFSFLCFGSISSISLIRLRCLPFYMFMYFHIMYFHIQQSALNRFNCSIPNIK